MTDPETPDPTTAEAPAAEVAPNPLFADADIDGVDLLVEAEGEEGDEKPEKYEMPAGLRKRLAELSKQKKAARAEAAEAKARVDAILADVEKTKPIAEVLRKRYASFGNPAAVLDADAEFMDIMESHKANPIVRAAIAFVQERRNGQPVAAQPAAAATPQKDPTVDKLLTRLAAQEIDSTLRELSVKPKMRKMLQEGLMAQAKDLAAVDREWVIEATRDWIARYDLTADDVLDVSEPEAPKRPPAGRARSAAPPQAPREPKENGAKASPKTLTEWQAGREERIRSLLSAGES